MRVRFDEDARREYLDAMVFYSGSGEKIGVKFADAVELAIAKIDSEPHRFREIEGGHLTLSGDKIPLLDSLQSLAPRQSCARARRAFLQLFERQFHCPLPAPRLYHNVL
jgi:hypothetical protein